MIVISVIIYQFAKDQFTRNAVVSIVQTGDIRDSVSGNVRVLAEKSFQLRSETQSKLEYAALIPFGKPIPVDKPDTFPNEYRRPGEKFGANPANSILP